MRSITVIAFSLVLAAPLVSLAPSAKADSDNGWVGQAQRLLNNGQNNDRDAYQRGREDELRREQAQRDRDYYRRNHDSDWNRAEPSQHDSYNGGGEAR